MGIRDIVTIYNDEPRAGTWLIAKGFGKEHRMVLELIKKYQINFENFSRLDRKKSKQKKGRPIEEYLLTEEQTAFLGTLFRNNTQVIAFKEKLIKEFYRMKNAIIRAKAQHVDIKWIEARQEGKKARLEATDTIKRFEAYAATQGSQNADMYYMNITKMMNSLLFIVEGKFKNLRELMTPRQLVITTAAEYVIDKALDDGMKEKMFYKEIYKLVKGRVQLFADLHGQSEIISNQLLLFDSECDVDGKRLIL